LKTTGELETQLAEEKKKSEEYLDQLASDDAEFQNFKRRAEKDKADYGQYANQRLLKRLLDVLDSFGAAFKTVPPQFENQPWVEGMRAV